MRIRDTGWKKSVSGWKKFGSGMEKLGVRDKHPGFATLEKIKKVEASIKHYFKVGLACPHSRRVSHRPFL
jgi:hypothetical protein